MVATKKNYASILLQPHDGNFHGTVGQWERRHRAMVLSTRLSTLGPRGGSPGVICTAKYFLRDCGFAGMPAPGNNSNNTPQHNLSVPLRHGRYLVTSLQSRATSCHLLLPAARRKCLWRPAEFWCWRWPDAASRRTTGLEMDASTIRPETISNDFGRFGNYLADSYSNFSVAEIISKKFDFLCLRDSITYNVTVHARMCCGLFSHMCYQVQTHSRQTRTNREERHIMRTERET